LFYFLILHPSNPPKGNLKTLGGEVMNDFQQFFGNLTPLLLWEIQGGNWEIIKTSTFMGLKKLSFQIYA
jgi:hypothetical protein